MSEPTSPLHDSASTQVQAREPVRLTLPNWRPSIKIGALTGTRALVLGFLIAIVLVGGYLRLTHNNWDHKVGEEGISTGGLHPDERFISQIQNDIRWPGFGEYFDTDTSDHHHFYLEDEQRVIDIPASSIVISNLPEPPKGMNITHVDVVVRVRKGG